MVRPGRFTPVHIARRFAVGAGRRMVALSAALAARDTPTRDVRDARTVRIDDNLVATVYWIDRAEVGTGPAVSVFRQSQELMRIDLFRDRPHVHYGLAQMRGLDAAGASVQLPTQLSCAAGADRAAFEIEHNLQYALTTHPSARVRRMRVDADVLARAAARLRDEIVDLAKIHDA